MFNRLGKLNITIHFRPNPTPEVIFKRLYGTAKVTKANGISRFKRESEIRKGVIIILNNVKRKVIMLSFKEYMVIFITVLILLNIAQIASSNSQMNEIDMYRMLYENEKELNNRVLSTIYWALGAILLVIIAILGANIFFSYSLNKKEIDNMANDYMRNMELYKKKTDEEINKKIGELKEKHENKIQEIIKGKIEKTINEMKIDKYNLEARVKILEGNKSDALFPYLQEAFLRIETGDTYNLDITLKEILEIMKEIKYFPGHLEQSFARLIDVIPRSCDLIKGDIVDRYREMGKDS